MSDRHQVRADWYDYDSGLFFITICSHNKKQTFGSISDNEFLPSPIGSIIKECIDTIPLLHPGVEVCNSVIMPNHLHLILNLLPPTSPRSLAPAGCLKPPAHADATPDFHYNSLLSLIIGQFKAAVSRNVRRRFPDFEGPIWHPRFHDHIIRNERAYENIMNYIDTNIENWHRDCFSQ